MDIVIISLIGIFLGVAVFIFCAFKGFNLTLAALFSALVMLLFSGLPVLTGITDIWMGGVAGSLKKFMLIFVLGTIFGKISEYGGSSKKIAYTLIQVMGKSKKHEKFFAAYFITVFYFILTFVGVSGFVIIFTVLAIGRELFHKCDVPWRFYCYCIGGIIMATVLGGSLAVSNVATMGVAGTTSPAAAMGFSVVMCLVFAVVHAFMLNRDIKKAEQKGEGFMASGSEIMKIQISDGLTPEELPGLLPAVTPMVVMILMCSILSVNVVIALTTGILLSILLFYKNLKKQNLSAVISASVVASFPPLINVCAASAVGTVIMAVPGFTTITSAMNSLPPLYGGVGLGMLASAIVASSTSTVPSFGPLIHEAFTNAGLSAAVSHRMIVLATNIASIPPHNAAVVNASSLTRVEYKQAAWIYGKASFVPGLAAMAVSVLLISMGIFI